jgi:hypothetical protein
MRFPPWPEIEKLGIGGFETCSDAYFPMLDVNVYRQTQQTEHTQLTPQPNQWANTKEACYQSPRHPR